MSGQLARLPGVGVNPTGHDGGDPAHERTARAAVRRRRQPDRRYHRGSLRMSEQTARPTGVGDNPTGHDGGGPHA